MEDGVQTTCDLSPSVSVLIQISLPHLCHTVSLIQVFVDEVLGHNHHRHQFVFMLNFRGIYGQKWNKI